MKRSEVNIINLFLVSSSSFLITSRAPAYSFRRQFDVVVVVDNALAYCAATSYNLHCNLHAKKYIYIVTSWVCCRHHSFTHSRTHTTISTRGTRFHSRWTSFSLNFNHKKYKTKKKEKKPSTKSWPLRWRWALATCKIHLLRPLPSKYTLHRLTRSANSSTFLIPQFESYFNGMHLSLLRSPDVIVIESTM